MTDTALFDERGARVPKVTRAPALNVEAVGWNCEAGAESGYADLGHFQTGWGFVPERAWRPTYYAARMSRGWRVFELDVGVVFVFYVWDAEYHRQSAAPDHRRFPSIAAVEVYLRTINAYG